MIQSSEPECQPEWALQVLAHKRSRALAARPIKLAIHHDHSRFRYRAICSPSHQWAPCLDGCGLENSRVVQYSVKNRKGHDVSRRSACTIEAAAPSGARACTSHIISFQRLGTASTAVRQRRCTIFSCSCSHRSRWSSSASWRVTL